MVGAVEDEVVLGDYADGVLGGEVLAVGVVFDVWVEAWARSAWEFIRVGTVYRTFLSTG